MERSDSKLSFKTLDEKESKYGEDSWMQMLKDKLAQEACLLFQAKGCSMLPFIREGDSVFISPLSSKMPGLGEVVAMIHPETARLFIHRIVIKMNRCVITKGDNTTSADGVIPGQFIFGSVTKIERNGKSISLGLGPERILIALLSRAALLHPLRKLLRSFF